MPGDSRIPWEADPRDRTTTTGKAECTGLLSFWNFVWAEDGRRVGGPAEAAPCRIPCWMHAAALQALGQPDANRRP